MHTDRNEQKRPGKMAVGLTLVAAMLAFAACSNERHDNAAAGNTQSAGDPSKGRATANERRDNAATWQNTKSTGDSSEGRATGVLTVHEVNVNLTHSYARFTQGFVDKNKQDVELLITEGPIPGDALLNEFERRSLLREGKRQGLFLLFDDRGRTLSINPYTESMAKNGTTFGSSGVGSLTDFSLGDGRVKGQHRYEDKMTDLVWSYSFTFDTPVKE